MTKRTCPFTYPHRSRRAKVDYICSIGGYYSRDGRFPIEFNVAAYGANFDFDHVWATYSREYMPASVEENPALVDSYKALTERLLAEYADRLFDTGKEDAVRCLFDDEAYTSLYDGTNVDSAFALHGQCGKHLVITRLCGLPLKGISEEELSDILMQQILPSGESVFDKEVLQKDAYWQITTDELATMYRYVREMEYFFTPARAAATVECEGVSWFFTSIVNWEWLEEQEKVEQHIALVSCAQCLHTYLSAREGTAVMSMLATLTRAAGVNDSELLQ